MGAEGFAAQAPAQLNFSRFVGSPPQFPETEEHQSHGCTHTGKSKIPSTRNTANSRAKTFTPPPSGSRIGAGGKTDEIGTPTRHTRVIVEAARLVSTARCSHRAQLRSAGRRAARLNIRRSPLQSDSSDDLHRTDAYWACSITARSAAPTTSSSCRCNAARSGTASATSCITTTCGMAMTAAP